jgi:hypothetical protein
VLPGGVYHVTLPFDPKSTTPSLRSDSVPLQIRPAIIRISSIPIDNTSFVNMSATKTAIVLKDSKDWPKWFAVTMSAAQEHDLAPYVDPYKSKRNLTELVQPIKPAAADIRPLTAPPGNGLSQPEGTPSNTQSTVTLKGSSIASITYKDLNEAERTQLNLKTQIYLHELRSYKEHSKAIRRLRTKVIETTHPDNFYYILRKDSVYDILMSLKNRFAASDYARKQKYTMK